jgi:hypothetical protein
MLIKALLPSTDGGILLENVGDVGTLTCSAGQILVDFADAASAAIARSWPVGTILITLADGCNASDERGVYVISKVVQSIQPVRRTRATHNAVAFTVTKSSLQAVVDELDISYGQLEVAPGGSQITSYTTTVTSYFTNSRVGTLTSSIFVSTITPTLTTATYTSIATSTSLTISSVASSSVASIASSVSSSFSLSPSAQAILDDLSKGLPAPGPDGTITIAIKKGSNTPVIVQPMGSEPYNTDPEYQAKLQNAMEADHLDSTSTMVTDATDALAEEADSNITPDSPVKLSSSDYSGTDDAVYDAATPVVVTTSSDNSKRNSPARAASAPAPRAVMKPTDITRLSSRQSLNKRDGWDTFFDVMGDDLVGEICEICGAMYVFSRLLPCFY